MKRIERTTLCCLDCYNYGAAVSALQKSMAQNEFDKVLFLTDIPITLDGIEVVQIPNVSSKQEYSLFCVKELWKYIDTDFVLLIQHDGYTINGDLFNERLYEFDFAGALWLEGDGYANGNGGYSWRSKKLLEAIGKDETIKATHPEDAQICRTYRDYLEKTYNLKWATDEICEQFSYELREPKCKTMGFHGAFHLPYRPTVLIRRDAALGDCLILEPLARYYALKGYNIVLDIPIAFFDLYTNHYFPVKHVSQFDSGRIKPEKVINLNGSYEVKPRQSYLKSYFEFAGITDYKLSRPQLYPLVDANTKLFKKYAVLHIDKRNDTPHRNIYNVNWKSVKKHLEAYGYTVVQIGRGEHEAIGLEINTPSVGFMKFVIAGADIFIGIDSAPLGIAMAYNKPCIGFFGSVNPAYIHPDMMGLEVIQQPCIHQHCWHVEGGTEGKPCVFDVYKPPCCIAETEQVIDAINRLHT